MTSYLISKETGPMPFTGADLCKELGIDPGEFGYVIDNQIAVEVIKSRTPCRHEVWWISTGERFEQESRHGTVGPSSISEPFDYRGSEFVACTYEPDDEAVETVYGKVMERVRNAGSAPLWRAIRAAADAAVNLAEVA